MRFDESDESDGCFADFRGGGRITFSPVKVPNATNAVTRLKLSVRRDSICEALSVNATTGHFNLFLGMATQ